MQGLRFSPAKASALAALFVLCACGQEQTAKNQASPAVEERPAAPVIAPVATLDRTAILAALAQSASAAAAGANDTEAQRKLDGRQFELRIRFGCTGQSQELREDSLGWSFDPDAKTLRVRAQPTLSADDPLVQQIAGGRFEAVEGFWIPRPWLLQSACPAEPAIAPSTTGGAAAESRLPNRDDSRASEAPNWPRVGIAHFFSDTDARTGRRAMRAYEAVMAIAVEPTIAGQGFDLVLSGRLQALPDKRVIACVTKGPQSPPECVISADFDRVWIEQPESATVVAEWTAG